jgi:3-isopropylmalate/(R)-2-methylmalate dehydratase large subunit
MMTIAAPRTLLEKIWDSHRVQHDEASAQDLLYVDRLLLTDTSSFHAFDLLRAEGHPVRDPRRVFGGPDHFAASRGPRLEDVADEERRALVRGLADDCAEYGLGHFGLDDPRMGISHVVGPEQGMTLPGFFLLCGDSHTSTHGALGALAFGIGGGTAHVMATGCLWAKPLKTLRVRVDGVLSRGVTAKDVILRIVAELGAAGGFGQVIEYAGSTIESMSVEARLTVCNMSIEAGARGGLIAPDETVFAYLKGRPMAPAIEHWDDAVAYWRTLRSDAGATVSRELTLDATTILPMVSWGNTAADTLPVTARVPDPADEPESERSRTMARALEYMGLTPGTPLQGLPIDQVFIGSCTNGRIEDLRAAAAIVNGRKVKVHSLAVPGSRLVKVQAEAEGLDRIFVDAGFTWGQPGCSMCVGTNGDTVPAGKRCVSTSNRNFMGRQGPGARTHLASPIMAAAAAVTGHITDVREIV